MKSPGGGLWAVWATRVFLRVAHTAHGPYYYGVLLAEVALFSVINWPCFQLTKTREVNAISESCTDYR